MTEELKPPEDVDAIMQQIPTEWRRRWCGGENGWCGCLGCVQIGNRAVIYKAQFGSAFPHDPEYINERSFPKELYDKYKVTRPEWDAWIERHPEGV